MGTAGVIRPDLKVRDIVIGQGACTNSNYVNQFDLPGSYAPICSYELLKKAVDAVKQIHRLKLNLREAPVDQKAILKLDVDQTFSSPKVLVIVLKSE